MKLCARLVVRTEEKKKTNTFQFHIQFGLVLLYIIFYNAKNPKREGKNKTTKVEKKKLSRKDDDDETTFCIHF